ncbi:gamma carbonic anhydrase 2, mitochondrial-like isoform X3 [Andrographis paniculata]|uniref:gamma carbonic anhydrase 2, mitochondrial-like isoform X3 n=1 Tax=Andrographis paniculata TaxID=175694 RepID=UPI0021E77D39|nr:gamma carbonic anhydrase 2, mitochondrial-like isoform X3 [Andrographis paniculata]
MGTLGRAIYSLGNWIRGTGQAMDRLGVLLQGSYYCPEQISRHRTLMNLFDKAPVVDKDAFVAPSASVIGDVQVGRGSSIWYGSVLRGDVNSISVGSGTNIQDNSLVHVAKHNLGGRELPTIIGNNVTIGHSAVLHGCTIEDEAFFGMGATLLDGRGCGETCHGCFGFPCETEYSSPLWGGNQAKFLRRLSWKRCSPKKFTNRDEEYESMIGIVRETTRESPKDLQLSFAATANNGKERMQ